VLKKEEMRYRVKGKRGEGRKEVRDKEQKA
jgi:hypothetical protein